MLGRVSRHAQDLDGPGPVRPPVDEPAFLQGQDQPVDAGLGLELKRLLHVLEAWGEPGLPEVSIDVREQLVLLRGQHEGRFPSPSRAAHDAQAGTKRQLAVVLDWFAPRRQALLTLSGKNRR